MTETIVNYHRDGFSEGRPAINVKVHAPGAAFWPPESVFPAAGTDGENDRDYDAIVEAAQDRVFGRFWQDAATLAEEYGLGPIEQEGRSGGWLVFTSPEAVNLETAWQEPRDRAEWAAGWLEGYRKLRDWCEAEVASAPARVAALAQSLAIDAAGERTITLRSWLAWGKEYAL